MSVCGLCFLCLGPQEYSGTPSMGGGGLEWRGRPGRELEQLNSGEDPEMKQEQLNRGGTLDPELEQEELNRGGALQGWNRKSWTRWRPWRLRWIRGPASQCDMSHLLYLNGHSRSRILLQRSAVALSPGQLSSGPPTPRQKRLIILIHQTSYFIMENLGPGRVSSMGEIGPPTHTHTLRICGGIIPPPPLIFSDTEISNASWMCTYAILQPWIVTQAWRSPLVQSSQYWHNPPPLPTSCNVGGCTVALMLDPPVEKSWMKPCPFH